MNYQITFFGENEQNIIISDVEFKAIGQVIDKKKFLFIHGELIAVGLIKRISPMAMPEPPRLFSGPYIPQDPISAEFLNKHRAKIAERFAVKNNLIPNESHQA